VKNALVTQLSERAASRARWRQLDQRHPGARTRRSFVPARWTIS